MTNSYLFECHQIKELRKAREMLIVDKAGRLGKKAQQPTNGGGARVEVEGEGPNEEKH